MRIWLGAIDFIFRVINLNNNLSVGLLALTKRAFSIGNFFCLWRIKVKRVERRGGYRESS